MLTEELSTIRARLESSTAERERLSGAAEKAQRTAHGIGRAADRLAALHRLAEERAATYAARLAAETEEGYRERIRLLESEAQRFAGDLTRLAELCGAVIAAADASRAPVFAGWRDLEEPEGERELVVHRMNALRELRAARHGAAVRAVGIEPVDAFMIRTPYMAAIFGWPEPTGEPDEATKARWAEAEELTDQAFARDLAVLSDEELDELCALTDELLGIVS